MNGKGEIYYFSGTGIRYPAEIIQQFKFRGRC
jgi:hypothetical protein